MADLDDLRRRIDDLDARIVDLLNERARIVEQIGRLKATANTPVYAPDREQEILRRVQALNPGPLPNRTIAAIYRELMSGSFHLERPLRIAFLGPPGSFSHQAARSKFGGSVEYEPLADIRAVFEEVARAHADFGVVPIENSTVGSVIDTIDAFEDAQVKICAELTEPVHHHLLANCPLNRIRVLYSKPEVFAQCQRWLAETGLADRTSPVASTSRAAELAASQPDAAAIASAAAADLYGLQIIAAQIEDDPANSTRFYVIGTESARPSGNDKTALLVRTAHRPGALVEVLNALRDEGINMTLIESRPSRSRRWEYFFFIEAEGHQDDPPMARAIGQARTHCLSLTVLGSFPQAAPAT